MAINQISTANTFEQWLIATQSLIAFANSITNSAPGTTFTSNTSEYVITGNLTVGNTVTAPVNTDVIIFDDGTRLSSNVQIVNSYLHANGGFNHANSSFDHANAAFDKANSSNVLAQNAFNKANSSNVLAQAAFDYANTIASGGEVSGENVTVLYTVTGNNLVANISITTTDITVTSNVTTSNIVVSNNVTVSKNVAANNISASNNITAILVSATDFNTTSDVALKTNMQQITNSLEVLEQLTGFVFNWKSDGKISYGVSAQQVEQILPDLVRMRDDGFKGVNYLNLIAFLIEAIKELKKEVMEIKNNNK
jgi:LysM repeat protein